MTSTSKPNEDLLAAGATGSCQLVYAKILVEKVYVPAADERTFWDISQIDRRVFHSDATNDRGKVLSYLHFHPIGAGPGKPVPVSDSDNTNARCPLGAKRCPIPDGLSWWDAADVNKWRT